MGCCDLEDFLGIGGGDLHLRQEERENSGWEFRRERGPSQGNNMSPSVEAGI